MIENLHGNETSALFFRTAIMSIIILFKTIVISFLEGQSNEYFDWVRQQPVP